MMNRVIQTSGVMFFLAATLAAPGPRALAAEGDVPAPAFYVGVFGGYHLVLDDWDLNAASDAGTAPDSSPTFGLRLGVQIVPWLGLEVSGAVIPYSADGGLDGTAASWRGDALVTLVDALWTPHVLLGGGVYQSLGGDLGDDADWELHYGAGLRGFVTDWLALRLEARHILTDSSGDGLASNVELTLGVDFVAWSGGARANLPDDRDGDTVLDDEDACPDVAGRVTAQGCPDDDGDGQTNTEDRCPTLPGPRTSFGCPDTDGDGITDDRDACPDTAGGGDRDGCPPAPPDGDGDGIEDAMDQCPREAGPVALLGCPDRDGDGVVDAEDRCPDQLGLREDGGCLPDKLASRLTGVIPGILFQPDSAVLDRRSYGVLDQVAKLLEEYPSLHVEVGGHVAQDEADQGAQLSQDRAETVRAYLIEQGIDASRIIARGYGASQPITAGGTAKARAQNRRIEMTLVPASREP